MRLVASKWVKRALAAFSLVAVLLVAGLAFRLMSGPISLGPLTSYVEQTLDETLEGLDVTVGDLVLRWSADDRDLQLRLINVVLASGKGSTVARVPEMEVALSAIGLTRGVVAPTRISLIGPSATIIRKNDGSFNVGVGGDDQEISQSDQEKPILEEIVDVFSEAPEPDRPATYLREFEISDAKLIFFDQPSQTYWRAPNALLGVRRQEGGIAGYVSAALDFGDAPWQIDVSGFLDPDGQFLDIEGQLEDVVLSKLQSVGDGFGGFKGINLPLSGSFELAMSADGELVSAAAELSARDGTIEPPLLNGDALTVSQAVAHVEYDASTGRVLIDRLDLTAEEGAMAAVGTVDLSFAKQGGLRASYFDVEISDIKLNLPNVFTENGKVDLLALRGRWTAVSDRLEIESALLRRGDSSFQVSGEVEQFGSRSPPIKLDGTFQKFDVDLFPSLWPIEVANGAHDWIVANLENGQLYDGKLRVDIPQGALDSPKLPDDALRFDFSYSGISVKYINGLPPVRNGKGKATLYGDSFELTMTGGATGGMKVSNGRVFITQLHRRPSLGDISVTLTGETKELLRILDLDPLGYPSEFGVDPQLVGGSTQLRLKVSLPLLRDLAFKDVGFDGRAQLTNLQIPNVLNDVGIDGGDAEIVVTNTYLDAIGALNIGTVEANVSWREEFEAVALPTEIKVAAKLDGADAKTFGADLSRYLMSDADVQLTLRGQGQDIDSAMLEADFTGATLDIQEMGWTKPAGKAATGQISVSSVPSGGWDFKTIRFDAEDATLRGHVTIADAGFVKRADFEEFKLGTETDAVIKFENSPTATDLSVKGEALNISGLIDRILNNSAPDNAEAASPKALDVALGLDTLTLANDVVLKDVKGQLHDTGGRIAQADFEGTFVDGGVVFAAIDPISDVERRMRLTASDAGKLLRGVNFTDQLMEGQLDLFAKLTELADGTSGDVAPEDDLQLITNGELSMKHFRVVNAPILAQLLMAGSPQGAQDLLNRDGIGFDRFFVPFQIRNGRISFDRSQALGPAIGITVGGAIDQNQDTLDLTGTIVPSYSINSAIGYVPVVGQLLVSREGEGLFAFTYNIQGPLEEPKIAVNPLSGLAPGFLRRIFQIGQEDTIVPKLKPTVQ